MGIFFKTTEEKLQARAKAKLMRVLQFVYSQWRKTGAEDWRNAIPLLESAMREDYYASLEKLERWY